MSSLLSRFAENSFWMARYMERTENLARIIDVNETFARNARGENDWLPILKLHQDEERFFETNPKADGARVIHFYLIDETNPNSVRCSVHAARENARSIRHLISLETWVQLNVFYNWVRGLTPRSLQLSEISRLCARIKEGCHQHFGIANSTLYRDQIWSFYRLGTYLELCDQTTRLVDIKYHALLPSWQDVGRAIDVAQWNALLRSASAYHGYRRVFPHQMTPTAVAGFVLLDPRFPRSITHCAREIRRTIEDLMNHSELAHVDFSLEELDELDRLTALSPEEIIGHGLHEYLDRVQLTLIALHNRIDTTFLPGRYAASTA